MKHKKKLFAIFVVILSLSLLSSCAVAKEIPADELAVLENDLAPRVQESDLRIMSANVLVHISSWGGEPVYSRADRFARALKHYLPDVIGAQEFCSDWYNDLMPMIKDTGYKVIKENYTLFTENRSPILYNSNVLEVVEHGIHKFSEGDDNGCRVVSWAVFKRKSDQKVFAVTSTHFDLIRSGKEEAQLNVMLRQAEEFFAQIDRITQQYHCPVFMCGDYNSMEERAEYKNSDYYGEMDSIYAAYPVYNKIAQKFADAKYSEEITRYDVGGGILPGGAWESPTWDHIFMTGEASVTSFAILSSIYFQRYENGSTRVSDHLPIFADFRLN